MITKAYLSQEQLTELASFCTPTIANAIETFEVRDRMEGVTRMGVQCIFPALGAMVGYACTAMIDSGAPPATPRRVRRAEYWSYLETSGPGTIAVMQDLSQPPAGAYIGEVNATIHQTLGCQGILTSGTVRDLDEVGRLNFRLFAAGVEVSHGWAHLEDFATEVTVFGMKVKPGDLLHVDKHGATVIPHDIASLVAEAARKVEKAERPMLEACRQPNRIQLLDELIPSGY
jgi:4-hydroxy-4-methyl-2-oxoglutarate aldolase